MRIKDEISYVKSTCVKIINYAFIYIVYFSISLLKTLPLLLSIAILDILFFKKLVEENTKWVPATVIALQ